MAFSSRLVAHALDWAMCAAMYRAQRRHRLNDRSRAELEKYIAECEPLQRPEFYSAPGNEDLLRTENDTWLWPSPVRSGYERNDLVQVNLFPCERGWTAPTVIFLHALMSTSDRGYRLWAGRFNERGWNACFVHLPFHYSRVPPGVQNGELAITADLVRNGQALRQAVCELRQLIALLRARGGRDFAVWGTSWGGWIGALLASVEELRFTALMEPIVDVHHAIWRSPAAFALRWQLRRRQIPPDLVARHYHLSSPLHARPAGDAQNVLLVGGTHDRIAPLERVAALHRAWPGSNLISVPQGHFGYQMMPAAWEWFSERGII
jgi:pimeloyl-ACP methyl ester carboxylesterase